MGWPQNAYVGQKVVCVGEPMFKPIAMEPIPSIGEIYTIIKIVISSKGNVYFQLKEIEPKFYTEMNWEYNMFRPVQSTEKGMEILRGLLNPKNHKNYKSKELIP